MDEVCEDGAPVTITRNREQAVVVLSLAEYNALEETAHLLRSPVNASRLLQARQELDAGQGTEHELVDS